MLDLRYRSILRMALPLMASTFIQSIVLITDSSFLSRHDTIAFDAVGNGGLIYITCFMALVGLSDGAQILMARRIGEKKENRLARIFGTTIFANFLTSIILVGLIVFVIPDIITGYAKNQEIASGQIDYLNIRVYGLFFAMVSLAINAYLMAVGKTTIVFISALFIAISNIGLDYILIFGTETIPMMGLKGAALASTLSDGIGMLFLLIALSLSAKQKKHKLFTELSYNFESFKEVIRIGSPIVLQGVIALSTWTVFFTWIEQIGEYELTISQTIRSLYFLAFVPVWGFGATTKTYVSQYIGKGDLTQVKIIIKRIQLLSLLFLFIFFHGAILYPETLIGLINPNEIYMKDTVEILRFVTGSVVIYSIGSVFFQTINGSGNTKFTFYIELIAVIVYIISAYIIIKIVDASIFWVWSVEYIYFISMGLFSVIYLKTFKWEKKQL
ncbi:MAG: MATE family efflux transporter [Crocinitomicaceae bacterium]